VVVGFGREKLVKMVRSRAWTGLYIVIVKVGKAYKHASEESEWLPSVNLPWFEVVVTTVFFLFLFVQ